MTAAERAALRDTMGLFFGDVGDERYCEWCRWDKGRHRDECPVGKLSAILDQMEGDKEHGSHSPDGDGLSNRSEEINSEAYAMSQVTGERADGLGAPAARKAGGRAAMSGAHAGFTRDAESNLRRNAVRSVEARSDQLGDGHSVADTENIARTGDCSDGAGVDMRAGSEPADSPPFSITERPPDAAESVYLGAKRPLQGTQPPSVPVPTGELRWCHPNEGAAPAGEPACWWCHKPAPPPMVCNDEMTVFMHMACAEQVAKFGKPASPPPAASFETLMNSEAVLKAAGAGAQAAANYLLSVRRRELTLSELSGCASLIRIAISNTLRAESPAAPEPADPNYESRDSDTGQHSCGHADSVHGSLPSSASPSPLQAPDWRPIETAPKDGTPILLARQFDEWGWIRGWGEWFQQGKIGGWIARGFYDPPGELGLASPTHWMPLPTPPKGTA